MHVDLTDRAEARKMRQLRMGWQSQAWDFRDQIGELRFAVNFLGNCAARMKLYVGAYSPDGETDTPVPIADLPGFGPNIVDLTDQLTMRLGNGRAALSGMLKQLSENFTIAGEGWLLGQEDPTTGLDRFTIRSIDEIVITESEYKLREIPNQMSGDLGWVTLDPDSTYLERMWLEHPRYRLWADSALRAILDDCESLLILRRGIRAAGRSRLAGAGFLLAPESLQLKRPIDDNEDLEADPFMGALAEAMMEPIADEGVASAVVPIVIRGAAEALKEFRLVLPGRDFDKLSIEIRQELVGVIATGLDLPKEVIEGAADLNHWSKWAVDDDTFRYHIEPHVIQLCHALTQAYLRPSLISSGVDPALGARMLYWYDPTELVTHPDRTADAKDAYAAMVISEEAYRREAGFGDADKPSLEELEARRLWDIRALPLNLLMEYARRADPSLIVPPITVSGTVPGIKAGGVDTGEPATLPLPGETAPPSLPAKPPLAPSATPRSGTAGKPGPPPLTASAAPPPPGLTVSTDGDRMCANCRMFDDGKCWGYGNIETQPQWVCDSYDHDDTMPPAPAADPTPDAVTASGAAGDTRLSRRLVAIDQDLRARLQVAANAAMLRQLERAGAKVRTHLTRGSNETMRMAIAQTRNEHVAGTLGRSALAAAGVSVGDLLSTDWSSLRPQFLEWTEAAATAAVATACKLAGLDSEGDEATAAVATLAVSREAAWTVLETALTTLGQNLLYDPDPQAAVKSIGELNPNTLVPAGTIRAALGVAGGGKVNDLGFDTFGNPTIPLGTVVGQVGTGATIRDLLTTAGATSQGYGWVHGPALHPFEPHAELDGIDFTSFTDPALANTTGFPDSQYFLPGDHAGCTCDFMPQWVGP